MIMFTGIIEGLGTIVDNRPCNRGCQLTIAADYTLLGSKIGDSIAVNGACLTITDINARRFTVDVSPETLDTTILGTIRNGDRVNLERALKLSDRLDGHLVSGHVDGIGKVTSKLTKGNALLITISVDPSLTRYMIKKGSVAVDGTSLTINQCDRNNFSVSIIPHTAKLTTINLRNVGSFVNIETDLIGKYVERFVRSGDKKDIKSVNTIDKAFLNRSGFL
jgi:riboflavin synthase